jgi:uncharacterized membrane protein YhaH (DUF805 family)
MSHQAQPQAAYAQPAPKPRRKRRVFLWFFLAIQIIFIVWLISAGVSTDHSVTHCVGQYCKGATEAGSAIGIGLIVVFWVIVDFLVTIPWVVYRLATRNRNA